MSRDDFVSRKPLISLVDRANRALQADMVRQSHARGRPDIKMAHSAVFATLYGSEGRAADMASRAGITRQSMGEIIRDMVGLGLLEMAPDPDDGRAKVVRYTEEGVAFADGGLQYIGELERRFADEFGAAEYDTARAVLAKVVSLLEEDRDRGQSGGVAAPNSVRAGQRGPPHSEGLAP